jgi:hypothetical protein
MIRREAVQAGSESFVGEYERHVQRRQPAVQIDEPREFGLAQIWIPADELASFLGTPWCRRLRLLEWKCFCTEILKHCARPFEGGEPN